MTDSVCISAPGSHQPGLKLTGVRAMRSAASIEAATTPVAGDDAVPDRPRTSGNPMYGH